MLNIQSHENKRQYRSGDRAGLISLLPGVRISSAVFILYNKGEIFIGKGIKYQVQDDIVIGRTCRGNEFIIDTEDYELIKQYKWKVKNDFGMICKSDGKSISMHSLIVGYNPVIHKNGNKFDNRKENLASAKGYHNNGKTVLNGYIAIYMPMHPKAFSNGCVYEHVLVAEEILGRYLNEEECVHHIDFNRKNNDKSNLIVFASNSDHVSYHAGGDLIPQPNGTYKTQFDENIWYRYINQCKDEENKKSVIAKIRHQKKKMCPVCKINYMWKRSSMCKECRNIFLAENKKEPKTCRPSNTKDICPVCEVNQKQKKAKMCSECYKKEQAKNIPSKEILESLIYNVPFMQIGRMYGVDGNSVKKWCKKYGLPHMKKDMKPKIINIDVKQENSLNVS